MNQPPAPEPDRRGKLRRLTIILAGILLGQIILYGPSLCGQKVLLPLNALALPDEYLPRTEATARIANVNIFMQDLILLFEPARRFAVSEIRAGRFPMWMPYQYGGVPFIEPRFSPFAAIQFCAESPIVLAWTQMALALVAGWGAYRFFRQVLTVGFWPSAICAWCYPLTGFFIFWQGYPLGLAACWLPWLLVAVDKTVRGTSRIAPLILAAFTCLTLISGHLDIAGQALLASGLFGIWRLRDYFREHWFETSAGKAVLKLAAGWTLGILLAAPQVLPVLEYSRTGDRMERRSAGDEERPPIGLSALPQTVLPDMYGGYGVWSVGNYRFDKENQLESSAAIYTGLIATLVIAPLAWCSRRHLSSNWFWFFLCIFGLSWCLNLPGFVQLLRLPGLNMMSHNRLVFVSSFGILALAATGLEVIMQAEIKWRWWLLLSPALVFTLAIWCLYRTQFLPEPVASQLGNTIRQGTKVLWINTSADVQWVQTWVRQYYLQSTIWCGLGLAGWFLFWLRRPWQKKLVPILGAVMLGDLLVFGYGRSLQCDPKLYYPRIGVLEQIANAAPGRIIGLNCLAPNLGSLFGLRDVRGYDGVDPARLVELVMAAADPSSRTVRYAKTESFVPMLSLTPEKDLRLSPIMDLLGVRYIVFRRPPFAGARPTFHEGDYWVMENDRALPRAFIPEQVKLAADKTNRLNELSSPGFDPRKVAYVESPADLPTNCSGTVEILQETPTRILLAVEAKTPALVVLADRWDKGWQASLNGHPAPILVANHALRGVVVPAGTQKLEFRYAPASFRLGLRLCAVALVISLGWLVFVAWTRKERQNN